MTAHLTSVIQQINEWLLINSLNDERRPHTYEFLKYVREELRDIEMHLRYMHYEPGNNQVDSDDYLDYIDYN